MKNNKALERPERPERPQRPQKKYEQQQRLQIWENMKLDCYTVYNCDPLDCREEYNNHFPRTKEGLARAKALVARGGYDLHKDTIKAHQCMSYMCVTDEEEFQAWCKAWNVKL